MSHCTYCEEDFDNEELEVITTRRAEVLACPSCTEKIKSNNLKPEDY